MQKAIAEQIQELLSELLHEHGRNKSELDMMAIAGNTTMLHLLTGADPGGMACLPFQPVFLETLEVTARSYGFDLPSDCRLIVLPGISAFVGADITAGVLSTGIDQSEDIELLLDIGTNGEMVLGNHSHLVATATAAGPAFEGAHIGYGCPGIPGALDHAGNGENNSWYTTIGDEDLIGICGSGLLDLCASLLSQGLLDETGFLELPKDADRFHPDPKSPVSLNQADIRQLQLAKGAIAAGVLILCKHLGIKAEQICRVHLAGGFGTFMSPESALAIGLLPAGLRDKIMPAGNTALKGALAVISRTDALSHANTIAGRVITIDLSADPEFQMAFAEAMLFPENTGCQEGSLHETHSF